MRFSRLGLQDVGLVLIAAAVAVSAAAEPGAGPTTAAVADDDNDPWIPAYHGRNVCEARTINYITNTLPELCLKTPLPIQGLPGAENGTSLTASSTDVPGHTTVPAAQQSATVSAREDRREQQSSGGATAEEHTGDGATGSELDSKPFMSFEEWKEMMMKKTGNDPAQTRPKRQQDGKAESDSAGISREELDGSGEDDAHADIEASPEKTGESAVETSSDDAAESAQDSDGKEVLYDDGKTQYYLSKDAGKTCKERFSYSSFDAGATILKASKGAKNEKAILVENKDTYMLLECAAKDKYVIVELSDDILVDTVVIANFEFFSSMIRHFRVSVSDRYPVKADKWKVLGEFEARNSRDIQPFLVKHPQIWAKYVKVEFLTHWGNEYYCPVSLLRIHGTRMIESWKDSEVGRDEDDGEEGIAQRTLEAEAQRDVASNATVEDVLAAAGTGVAAQTGEQALISNYSSWLLYPRELYFEENRVAVCATTDESRWPEVTETPENAATVPDSVTGNPIPEGPSTTHATSQISSASTQTADPSVSSSAETKGSEEPSPTTDASVQAASSSSASSTAHAETIEPAAVPPPSQAKSSAVSVPPPPRSKSSSSSSAAAPSPTVQESFFKTVSKRLQVLESNTTMSLKYIEDQFKVMRDALLKIEKRQNTAAETILESLNSSATAELRVLRQQYEQVWQSTVITLESNREQTRREILALSARLTILADEVVFQKRMAIIQSVLLLSCLALVIFSRGLATPAAVAAPVTRLAGEPVSSPVAATPNVRTRADIPVNIPSHPEEAIAPREISYETGLRPTASSRGASSHEVLHPLTPVSDHSTPSDSFEHDAIDIVGADAVTVTTAGPSPRVLDEGNPIPPSIRPVVAVDPIAEEREDE